MSLSQTQSDLEQTCSQAVHCSILAWRILWAEDAELGQESQASSCLRKGTPLASRVAQGH